MAKKDPKPEPEEEAPEEEPEEQDPIAIAIGSLRRSYRRHGYLVLTLVLVIVLVASAGEVFMVRKDMELLSLKMEERIGRVSDQLARVQDQTASARVGIDIMRNEQAHIKAQLRHMSRFLVPKEEASASPEDSR